MVLRLMPYTLLAYGLSDMGLVRKNNEDVWGSLPEHHLFVLADGMGGHQAGEVASREATNHFLKQVKECLEKEENIKNNADVLADCIRYILEETNHFVYELSKTHELLRGMGTTMCCVYFHESEVVYAHVGDSRIYRLRNNTLKPLTRDHSLLRELIYLGQMPTKYIEETNYKNIITRAIGTEPFVEPVVCVDQIEGGDMYLLCTDGLTDLLSNEEIEEILRTDLTVEEKVRHLIVSAKRKGGHDNITCVCVQVNDNRDI